MKKVWSKIVALHRDEKGADMVEYVLIIAAVALPLMAVAIWFWKDISKQANQWWGQIKGANPPSDITDPNTIP